MCNQRSKSISVAYLYLIRARSVGHDSKEASRGVASSTWKLPISVLPSLLFILSVVVVYLVVTRLLRP